ncbi:endomucin isoform X1 [Sturnira hondurensis]|uniref:endomucin isoform X1 n=1 Tax=Sturnira hondurensis TaxID=192404 RepID=UPI001879E755|nr:endomucin isoform X1 [Sturnira hondurensis]
MTLLQGTILCLLLVSSLRSSEGNDNQTTSALDSAAAFATGTSVPTQVTKSSSPDVVMTSTVGTSPKGTTIKDSIQTSPLPPFTSITTMAKGEGATTSDVMKKNLTTATVTVRNHSLPSTVSTLQSAQDKIKNPSSINTTQIPVSTPQPDASTSETSISPLVSTTIPENISASQGTQNAKNASPSSTNPSRSSIILPVVIALIVLTLSVFALVGLYRMCRKTDPGTPDNGNDQPQSDKESVKLLTVKTISHESGEHSTQGKTKN